MMLAVTISAPAVPRRGLRHRAVRPPPPEPATATWTTISRSERAQSPALAATAGEAGRLAARRRRRHSAAAIELDGGKINGNTNCIDPPVIFTRLRDVADAAPER